MTGTREAKEKIIMCLTGGELQRSYFSAQRRKYHTGSFIILTEQTRRRRSTPGHPTSPLSKDHLKPPHTSREVKNKHVQGRNATPPPKDLKAAAPLTCDSFLFIYLFIFSVFLLSINKTIFKELSDHSRLTFASAGCRGDLNSARGSRCSRFNPPPNRSHPSAHVLPSKPD